MTRQPGEEHLTDREVEILDLTDEWHTSSTDVRLVKFIAERLGISEEEAFYEVYGRRTDGAAL